MSWTRLRHFFQSRSISFRLYAIIIPTTIVAISGAGYLGDRAAVRMADARVEASTLRVANQLAADLSSDSMLNNPEALGRWIGEVVETNDFITRVDVYELSSNTIIRLATTSTSSRYAITIDEMTAAREFKLLVVPQFKERDRFLKVIAPISGAGGGTGCVSVVSTLRQSDIMGEVHSRIALFLIPGSVLLLVAMLHYLFTRVLTRRVNYLLAAMTQARQGNLQKRVLPGAEDELGTIARGFNEMMEELERAALERDRLLEEQKGFNQQLQDKVREATQDLSAANERLRHLNQDLMETQLKLTQLERMAMAGQMAATFAHEIGSPLSAISTHLQLLSENPATPETARERLHLIQEQVCRIIGFVEEMLVETRAATQTRTPLQVNQILRQLLLFLEQHLQRHRIKLETAFSEDLPYIDANAQQLQQVFLNLFNNACDAMPEGGTIRVETRVEPGAGGTRFVAILVRDDGIGIPKEKQEHIFKPFFTTKDLRRGTGLGLTIADRIIRQHEGTITLESVEGVGTAFTIRFPAADEPGRKSGE